MVPSWCNRFKLETTRFNSHFASRLIVVRTREPRVVQKKVYFFLDWGQLLGACFKHKRSVIIDMH